MTFAESHFLARIQYGDFAAIAQLRLQFLRTDAPYAVAHGLYLPENRFPQCGSLDYSGGLASNVAADELRHERTRL